MDPNDGTATIRTDDGQIIESYDDGEGNQVVDVDVPVSQAMENTLNATMNGEGSSRSPYKVIDESTIHGPAKGGSREYRKIDGKWVVLEEGISVSNFGVKTPSSGSDFKQTVPEGVVDGESYFSDGKF